MNPALVKEWLFPLHELLKGKPTHACLRKIERTQWLDRGSLRDLQFERLRQHLDFAYREVPYYTRLLNEHGLEPRRITSFEDFARIPCLTREMIRTRFDDLQPSTRPRRVQRMSTGGSTGSPVTVLVDTERAAFNDAARMRAQRWFGVDVGAREIVLWGSPIELAKQDRLRQIRDRLINSRLLSAFDLGEFALARYAKILGQDRPQKLYGYASAVYLLARYLKLTNWRNHRGWPQVIFTTAEPLYDFQRRTIETVFGCPVSVEYGARDAGLMANECPSGGLHIPAEGILIEIEGAGADGLGEIVVTNLYSLAMPIIRYRTGDVGRLENSPCACGRGLPRLRSVEGRRTDFLVTPEGKILHALAVIYILREIPSVREFQVIQEAIDRVTVKIVPDGDFLRETRDHIASRIGRLFNGKVSVEIEIAEDLARVGSGKHRYVVSKIADDYLDKLLGAQGKN